MQEEKKEQKTNEVYRVSDEAVKFMQEDFERRRQKKLKKNPGGVTLVTCESCGRGSWDKVTLFKHEGKYVCREHKS